MEATAARNLLERDGYAVVPDLLSPGQVGAIAEDSARLAGETPLGRNDFEGRHTRRVYNLVGKSRLFDPLIAHPLVLPILEHVLGAGCVLSSAVGIQIGPGERAQRLHHDDALYPVPRPRPALTLSAMWAIDDFSEANGATRIVPRSHGWAAERADESTATIAIEMGRGSLLLYLGTLWHGGGANRTDAWRLGANFLYARGWLRQLENQYLAVPRDVAAGLPSPLQSLLGYDVHVPFIGYVDGRHPARLLQR